MTCTTTGASSSRLAKLALALLALCVLAMGATAASAHAANTVAITAPSNSSVNATSTVTATGHADAESYLRVFSERNGSGACPDPDSRDADTQALGPDTMIVSAGEDYSKDFTFHPQSPGTYVLCGFLLPKTPPGSPQIASAPQTVTVSAELPSVTTTSAAAITGLQATLRGSVQTTGSDASWHFEYGTDPNNLNQSTPSGTVSPGAQNGAVAADLAGLTPSTPYHFRLVATNGGGRKEGQVATFTTAPPSSLTLSPLDRKDDETWSLSMTGSAGTTSFVEVFSEFGGSSCASTAPEQANRPGVVREGGSQVPAGPFSALAGGFPLPRHATAGVYLVCAYAQAEERRSGLPEAIGSTSVTVTHWACPDTRFSVALGKTPFGYGGGLSVTTPREDYSFSDGRFVFIESSDKGVENEQEDHAFLIEQGGTNVFGVSPAFDTTYTKSFSQPVSVTYTLTYIATSAHGVCELPDGTLIQSSPEGAFPALKSAPQRFVVTYRNGKAVGGGVEGSPFEAPINEEGEGKVDPAIGIAVQSLAGGIVPKGAAAKIGTLVKKGAYPAKLKAKKAGKAKIVWTAIPPVTDGPKAARAKAVVLASGAKTFKRPGKGVLKIKLSKKGKALLKKAGDSLQVKVAGSFTAKGKKKVTITRIVTLKR